jgi:hypothetical protein
MEIPTFATGPYLFIAIIFGYILLCLFIGGKKAYFEPFVEPPEEAAPPATSTTTTTQA